MTTQEIWRTYHLDVKRFIYSKTKNEEVVDDILQNTFIKIHTKLESLKDTSKVKSWVMTIAYNTMMDYFKQHTLSQNVDDLHLYEEEYVEEHDEKDCLYGIIKSLPKKYRDPLFLFDIKGLKQAEVASQLKLELPTTKSRIQRARKMITKGYMDCCDFKLNNKGYLVGEIKDKKDCKVCS